VREFSTARDLVKGDEYTVNVVLLHTNIIGHKLKPGKFRLNPRKNFFPLRVTEPWPRLSRGAVESPSLEIFQPRLDTVRCPLLWVTLLGQGVGLGDPQRSLPTPNIL